MNIRIGTWQGPIVDNGLNRNLAKVREVIDQTKDLKLDFLCFPEVFLSGYSAEAITESSVPLDCPPILEFITESSSHGTVILVGMSERRDDRIYNTQLVIHEGKLLGTYHKTILTGHDAKYFATDLDLPVFDAKGIRFGVVICHDTSFVEPALYLRWRGARLLFTPHFNSIPPGGFPAGNHSVSFWDHRTMVLNNQAALATLLKMVVVRSNVIIITPEHLGSGDSNIWNMDGERVAAGTPFVEGVVTAEFDRRIFIDEHWIDRRQVPAELLDMIARAAHEYPR
ncbi:MAG: carbon-nitrogen hydrolase family protein [Anaerolineae bacterium]